MREIAPARKCTLLHDVEARQIEGSAPILFSLKCTWSSAAAPLSIMRPADRTVPPDRWHVFVNDCHATVSQNATDFIQHQSRILRVMQYVTKQHGVETVVPDGKMTAIVRKIIDPCCRGVSADVETNHSLAEHALQMMRDEPVATTDVEDVSVWRQHTRDFKRHVICSTNLSASTCTFEASFDG